MVLDIYNSGVSNDHALPVHGADHSAKEPRRFKMLRFGGTHLSRPDHLSRRVESAKLKAKTTGNDAPAIHGKFK